MTAAVMAAAESNWDPALVKLVDSLNESDNLTSEQELSFLQNLLKSKELNALVNVHSKVAQVCKDDRLAPLMSNSMQIALEVLEQIASLCHVSEACKEVFYLLQRPHVQSLLCAHDAIAQKDFYPHLPDIPIEVDEDEETVKIVQLVKSNEPLVGSQCTEPTVGATIKTDEVTGKIIIARIMHGGAADRSGLIHVGDEVIEVNGVNVQGRTPGDVLDILTRSEGTITFKLLPSDNKSGQRESKVRVRCHFSYNPDEDCYIPCKEAGLQFEHGDILHIVSQDDHYWWQARHENERTSRAGLIPSRPLVERRTIHDRSQCHSTSESTDTSTCTAICTTNPPTPATKPPLGNLCHGMKIKKIMYDLDENDDFDREMIASYEDVAKLYPRPGFYRPIVLIGAPGVGRNELKRRLVVLDPEKYRSPVPYTTRQIRPGEVAGREYLYVSREKLNVDISGGKFIESGEYKGHLYGTSAESVKTIVNAGCVCILSPHYQAIKALRTPQLKPYIIHVKPPPFAKLKESRTAARARSTFDETNSRGFSDEEFEDMIKSCERIDYMYGHFFDAEIINDDLATAFERLVTLAERVETEPMWAPASWVQ